MGKTGIRIKRLMLEKSPDFGKVMTYKDLAEVTGLGESTIERYANDRVDDPRYNALLRMAQYFGVSVEYLMGDSDNPHGIEEGNRVAVALTV